MIPSRTRSASRRALVSLAGFALLTGSLAAQSAAGSANSLFISHTVDGAGGESSSPSFSMASGVAQAMTGPALASANFQIVSGVTAVAPAVATDAPLLFGVGGGLGEATGGDAVSVFGFGFTAAGAGPNTVDFGALSGTATTTVSNTEIQVTTPAGVQANGNPLGFTSVGVTNALGSHEVGDRFLYRPGLTLASPARVGGEIRMRQFSAPGSFAAFLFGGSVSGLSIPVPPYAGALELVLNLKFVTGLIPLPTGQVVLTNPIAPNPALAGVVLELQALSFDNATLATGSFSNRLTITFLP